LRQLDNIKEEGNTGATASPHLKPQAAVCLVNTTKRKRILGKVANTTPVRDILGEITVDVSRPFHLATVAAEGPPFSYLVLATSHGHLLRPFTCFTL
jgi:hypothetical protein